MGTLQRKTKRNRPGYMQLIRNILRLVCILTDKAVPANDKDALDGVSSDLDKLHLFEQLLDTMHSVYLPTKAALQNVGKNLPTTAAL